MQIVSDVISFFVGGFHTSGYLLTWLLWYLASNPASQDKLLDELQREVGGECGDRLKAYALRTDTYVSCLYKHDRGYRGIRIVWLRCPTVLIA